MIGCQNQGVVTASQDADQVKIRQWYTSVQKKCTMFKKNAPPSFGVFKKILNNKNNLLVKVKFMKK